MLRVCCILYIYLLKPNKYSIYYFVVAYHSIIIWNKISKKKKLFQQILYRCRNRIKKKYFKHVLFVVAVLNVGIGIFSAEPITNSIVIHHRISFHFSSSIHLLFFLYKTSSQPNAWRIKNRNETKTKELDRKSFKKWNNYTFYCFH